MFVSTGAINKLTEKRKEQFFENYITKLISEAKRLKITENDIISMIERGFKL